MSLAEVWVSAVISVLTLLPGMRASARGNPGVAHVGAIAGITAELSPGPSWLNLTPYTPCLLPSRYLLMGICCHTQHNVAAQLIVLPPSPVVMPHDSTRCEEGVAQPPTMLHLLWGPRDSSQHGHPGLALTLLTAAGMSFPILPGSHGDSGCKGIGMGLSYRSSLLLN